MDEVMKFAMTFKEFPPRSIPPSFSAGTIMEEVLQDIKFKKELQKDTQTPKKK